jgi:predicted acyl esterase
MRRSALTRASAAIVAAVVAFSALAAVQPAGAGPTSTPWPGGIWEPDAPRYGMTVESRTPITMDDGATLYATIGYPADAHGARAPGSFPVLLTQSPYLSSQQAPRIFFVSRGYIHAIVQVRGTGDTTGPDGGPVAADHFSPRQVDDAVSLVDWASKLPGSNGRVGMYGCSHLGVIQIFTAASVGKNSPLKAIVPACAYYGYDNNFASGIPSQTIGLIRTEGLAEGLYGPKNAAANDAFNDKRLDEILASGPQAYEGRFWRVRSTLDAIPRIVENRIPALFWSGTFASDGPGTWYQYSAAQNAHAGRPPFGPMSPKQEPTGRYQVIIGPWNHGQGIDDALQLEWFDTWLKNQDTGMADTKTPMHVFETGSNRWVNGFALPVTNRYKPLYLASGRALSAARPAAAGSAAVRWGDPTAPGTTLTFDAPPLTRTQVVAGPVAATVYASSDAENLSLIATLFDVAPDGTAIEITTGNVLGSFRALDAQRSWHDEDGLVIRPVHKYDRDRFAKPGSVQRYDIALNSAMASIAAGHRLRLVLSTAAPQSKCAGSFTAALTVALPCLPTDAQRAALTNSTYEIRWSRSKPSSLNVGLVDPTALPSAASGVTPTSNNRVLPLDWSS